MTNIITDSIYTDKDQIVKLLNPLIKNGNNVILLPGKQSCTVIIVRNDYIQKLNNFLEQGTQQRKYTESDDKTFNCSQETIDLLIPNLHFFQTFIYGNFEDLEHYYKMSPAFNQPNLSNRKLRLITDLRRTYTNNASQVIGNYLKPLAKNENVITNTFKFPKLWKSSGIDDSYEDIPYSAQLLFTSISISETIN